MTCPLRLDAEHRDDGIVLVVNGDIDAETADSLRSVVLGIVASTGRVELDLHGVPFMDSSGLHVLAEAATLLRRTGGSVAIHRPSERVLRLLTLTGMDEVVRLHEHERI